ncbi:hypothetical protein [Psychromonas sp. MB-3u-54]|uniref:hypothetical protein n=1 Tax=Psychromonas sp. MB-3u-54 TaxID=2058319 RepID=UPI00267FD445
MAVGALLADYLGDQGTFTLAAWIGLFMTLFSVLLPSMQAQKKRRGSMLIWFGAEQAMFVLAAFFILACVLFAFFDKNSTKEVCA